MGTRNLFEPRRDLVCLDCPVGLVLGEIVMADFQLLLSLSFGPSQLLYYCIESIVAPVLAIAERLRCRYFVLSRCPCAAA